MLPKLPCALAASGQSLRTFFAAEPDLVIFQDGVERVRLPAGGQLPSRGEDLFALVDIQGSVKSVSIVWGALPPRPVLQQLEFQALYLACL